MPSLRPLSIHALALSALIACAAPLAFAQEAPTQASQQAIQQQMTPEEFKAAGLDKLSPDELARLNAWLGRTIDTQTAKAAANAKQEVEHENRGFFNFGSEEPIVAHLAGEFRSFGKGKSYTLDNGQVWQQIDDAELVVRPLTNPEVRIKPAMVGNSWYMSVGKYNSRAQVRRIK
jgi:hypothetical protein